MESPFSFGLHLQGEHGESVHVRQLTREGVAEARRQIALLEEQLTAQEDVARFMQPKDPHQECIRTMILEVGGMLYREKDPAFFQACIDSLEDKKQRMLADEAADGGDSHA